MAKIRVLVLHNKNNEAIIFNYNMLNKHNYTSSFNT